METRSSISVQDDRVISNRAAAEHDARIGAEGANPEQVHGARLAVASAARDADECRMLLEMLGLLPWKEPEPR